MAKLTQAQMKENAKSLVLEAVNIPENAELVDGFTYAIPVTVEDQEIWVECKLTCKNWYDTSKTVAYDPFVKQQEYQDTLAAREKREQERAAKKAAKLAKKNSAE